MRIKLQTTETLDSTVELFKAFADPVRLRLMNLLAEGEVCVCHLHEALELPQLNGFPASGVFAEARAGRRPQGRVVGPLPAGQTRRRAASIADRWARGVR